MTNPSGRGRAGTTVSQDLGPYLRRLRDEPVFFMRELYRATKLDRYTQIGEEEADMIEFAFRGPQKRVLLARRGIGKTYLCVAGQAAWRHYCDPNAKQPIVSKSEGHAKDTVKLIRKWYESVPFLKHLKPTNSRLVRDNERGFDVGIAESARDPSLYARGIEGQITGGRGHIVYGDDVETPENTKTLAARDQLAKTVPEFARIASYGNKEVFYVGTFHHNDSIYPKLESRGYTIRTYPMILPAVNDRILGLAPMLQERLELGGPDGQRSERDESGRYRVTGSIVFKNRDTAKDVTDALAEGDTDFAMQMALVANAGDILKYPLRLSDLIVPDFDFGPTTAPRFARWGLRSAGGASTAWGEEDIPSVTNASGSAESRLHKPFMTSEDMGDLRGNRMRIDPAGRGKDQTAYAVVGSLGGYLWALTVGGFGEDGSPAHTRVGYLAEIARDYHVREIRVESNFGGDAFAELLESAIRDLVLQPGEDPPGHLGEGAYPDGWNCRVELLPAKPFKKHQRIIGALEPVMASHRLVVHRRCLEPIDGLARDYELQYQISAITSQDDELRHDDKIEVLADCVADWTETLAFTPEQYEQRRKAQARDAAMEAKAKRFRMKGYGATKWIKRV